MRTYNVDSRCARKVRHPTREAANAAARHHKGRQGFNDLVEPYHCQSCGGWHIGHPEPRTLKQIFQGVSRRRKDRHR